MKAGKTIVVVSDPGDIEGAKPDTLATADEYLDANGRLADPSALVLNLCRDTSYGSKGYYVSLLADARGQRVLPSVKTAAGLAEPYTRFRALQEAGVPTIDAAEMIVRRRKLDESGSILLTVEPECGCFPAPIIRNEHGDWVVAEQNQFVEALVILGNCDRPELDAAARAVYHTWPAPLLRMQVVCEAGEWKIAEVSAASPNELNDKDRAQLVGALDNISDLQPRAKARHEVVRASIAVLVDPDNPFSPSSPETIDRLASAAARANVHIARIGLNDLRRLAEYDALFVRAHTSVTQQGFQFALRAEALDMPVVDATQSTIRCTNKVYLEELLRRAAIPTPQTLIITDATEWSQLESLGSPFVLKLPDGDFSAAVHKVSSHDEFAKLARDMFRQSPLLIAQEWLPTSFDWRIGVLNGKVLFAAKYHMARGHWKIRTVERGTERYGRVEAVPRRNAPTAVVELALRAAALIGDGFYGVDLKESQNGPVVIEVNDNPNLDVGYEDAADGDVIYDDIIQFFLNRIETTGNTDADHRVGVPLEELRKPILIRNANEDVFGAYQVVGLELEYPIVDRDLNIVPLVEPAFKVLAGRGTSDVDLGAIGFSNEFADHVFELKTQQPLATAADLEEVLYEGVQRFAAVLRDEFDARLFPTAMHPWFDPAQGRLWTRSGLRIYTTYARLFDVRTHGWMNVQAAHVNLPFGDERETMTMLNAAAMLVPYLPAIAASSPMHDGKLQETVDSRVKWLTRIQDRVPESCGQLVPEYADSFSDYRKDILQPMYAALDRIPHTSAIRSEFFNTRAAILRFSRRALEVRILDTQECVKMDVAIATFVRWSIKHLAQLLTSGRIKRPDHDLLVADFHRTMRHGSAARVHAPYIDAERDAAGLANVKHALMRLLDGARAHAPATEMKYLDMVEDVIRAGSLSERIRAELEPYDAKSPKEFAEAARRTYIELMDCLESNEPWAGRHRTQNS